MIPLTIWDRIREWPRDLVRRLTLPLYLWSIRQPSLQAYANALVEDELWYRKNRAVPDDEDT